ncbi:hypothetical protein SAMN05444392_10743 [Seinonella peptonophila]|uniref:Uncharacterized protein n=2 Tax=Seinonella peptonophila TaxID=112248 RepID=A0A1M4YNF1_9BACL|nr:hypothetical protein SAMN05444392_10743 [Seinonella peptonophila]
MAAVTVFSFRANCSSLRRRMLEEASYARPWRLPERDSPTSSQVRVGAKPLATITRLWQQAGTSLYKWDVFIYPILHKFGLFSYL